MVRSKRSIYGFFALGDKSRPNGTDTKLFVSGTRWLGTAVGRRIIMGRHDDDERTTGTTTSAFGAALTGRRSVPFIPPTLVRDAVEASRRVATVTAAGAVRRDEWDVERGETTVSGRGGGAVAAEDVERERMEAMVPLAPTVRREDSAETADGARADHLGEDSDADGVEGRSGDSDEKGRMSRVKRKRRSMCDALLNLKARDVIAGLQIATLITLVALLYTATRAVDSFKVSLLSEKNENSLNDALSAITNASNRIGNVTARVESVANDIGDISGKQSTKDDVQETISSLSDVLKNIESVTQEVREYAEKDSNAEDVENVIRKIGKLVDKGLDEFDNRK